MPVIFRDRGYRFFFFSNEGDPREPMHIHARKGDAIAKFWINPRIAVADSYGIDSAELRELSRLAPIFARAFLCKIWAAFWLPT